MRTTLLLLAVVVTALPASSGRAATARDIEIPAGKASIAGTLLSPLPSVAVPCVVILGGTLSHTRDGALTEPAIPNRNALKRLAEALAAAGYASLRYDRVGYGQSKRGPGWTGTYHDEAEVAARAIAWARQQPEVSEVIVAAESAGAYLACLAAEAGTQAKAYVFLGGFCSTCQELYDYNFGRLARYAESSPERKEWAEKFARRDLALGRHYTAMLDAAAAGKDQFELVDGSFRMNLGLARRREELKDPPGDMFRHIKAPALALAGKEDNNVPSEHAWRIACRIYTAGTTNVASFLISACDHSFQWSDHDRDIAFRERYSFDSFKRGYNPDVYDAMVAWLQEVIPSPSAPARAARVALSPYQRAIAGPERDTETDATPERLQLAPGVEIITDITDKSKTPGVDTLEGRIGPLLLAESSQAHFIDLPAGSYTAEHPHSTESIIYTVRGSWVLCSQGRRQLMKPGALFRFGARISTGYEVPFAENALILIFKGKRSTDRERDFMDYLRGMAASLQRDHQQGEPFLLKELPADHPARVFARDVNPAFDKP
jgi:pimeloyl-ACP methyl ester carboxylesterase